MAGATPSGSGTVNSEDRKVRARRNCVREASDAARAAGNRVLSRAEQRRGRRSSLDRPVHREGAPKEGLDVPAPFGEQQFRPEAHFGFARGRQEAERGALQYAEQAHSEAMHEFRNTTV